VRERRKPTGKEKRRGKETKVRIDAENVEENYFNGNQFTRNQSILVIKFKFVLFFLSFFFFLFLLMVVGWW
jgi:hypothetical protein